MAEQLTGVLREVLAVADGTPRPAFSAVFSPEVQGVATSTSGTAGALAVPAPSEIVAGLPLPLVDRADPAAGYLATFAGLGPDQRIAALTQAASGDPSIPQPVTESAEIRLALVRARIDAADYDGAAGLLADLAAEDPSDWRVAWYHGLRSLAVGRPMRGARSTPCSASCPARSRPSWPWPSRPRRPATRPRPRTTSAWSGR